MTSFDLDSVASDRSSKPKRIDPNIMIFTKKGLKVFRNGKKKIITVEYPVYGTRLYGNIRNAATGEYMDHMVGSNDENLYFKIIMTSTNKPITLFYNSPAEYEEHQQQDLSDEIKTVWRYKRDAYIQ